MPAPFDKIIVPPSGPWASFPAGIGAPGLGTIPKSGGRRKSVRKHRKHRKSTRRHITKSRR